jgi:electron transport complex protein RnfB
MSGDPYKKLALRLDAIPNGFPATDSGVELDLLAKMFTAAEAEVASLMRLHPEPPADIAVRAETEPDAAAAMLEQMAHKGLIISRRVDGERVFGLRPFIVGIYEEQLGRMDKDLALLLEQYYQQTRGAGMIGVEPAVHRVIPVQEAIPFEVEIFPYEKASQLIESAKAWGLRRCICRVQRQMIGKACDHPIENCILFAPVEGAFDGSENTRPVTKDEALRVLHEAEEAGLVHSTANHQGMLFYICNCCSCCCGVLRGLVEFGAPSSVARSDFYAVVDCEACVGCGSCIDRCHFSAISISEDVCVVNPDHCLGCGLCVSSCPEEALTLQRHPDSDRISPPVDEHAWMAQRARKRGISLEQIL